MVKPFQHAVIVGHQVAEDSRRFCAFMEIAVYYMLGPYTPASLWVMPGDNVAPADDAHDLRSWFGEQDLWMPYDPEVASTRPTLDGRFHELAAKIGNDHAPVVVICSWEEQDWVRFVARRLFRNLLVEPVVVDGRRQALRLARQLAFPFRLGGWFLRRHPRPVIRTAPAQN